MAAIYQDLALARVMTGLRWLLCCACISAIQARGQSASVNAAALVPASFQTLDRVVATVNDEVILDSDVDVDLRFQRIALGCAPALETPQCNTPVSREQVTGQLIDRRLIAEQMLPDEQPPITEAQADSEIAALIPQFTFCHIQPCDAAQLWASFLQQRGFTAASFRDYWLRRQAVLVFIEQRFRPEVTIDPQEAAKYYADVLLPRYRAQDVQAPPLAAIKRQIDAILIEKSISALLDDWLVALRAQSRIQTFVADVPSQ